MWTVSLPLTLVNTATQQPPQPLQALDFVGWAMFVLGLVLEVPCPRARDTTTRLALLALPLPFSGGSAGVGRGALSNSAVDRHVLWNQLPELVKD